MQPRRLARVQGSCKGRIATCFITVSGIALGNPAKINTETRSGCFPDPCFLNESVRENMDRFEHVSPVWPPSGFRREELSAPALYRLEPTRAQLKHHTILHTGSARARIMQFLNCIYRRAPVGSNLPLRRYARVPSFHSSGHFTLQRRSAENSLTLVFKNCAI